MFEAVSWMTAISILVCTALCVSIAEQSFDEATFETRDVGVLFESDVEHAHDVIEAEIDSTASMQEHEDRSRIEVLGNRFSRTARTTFWRVLWTSVGWAIGMAIPVCLIGIGVIWTRISLRKAEKIQVEVLNERLSLEHRRLQSGTSNVETAPLPD